MGTGLSQKNKHVLTINLDMMAMVLFALFYAMPFLKWAVENIMGLLSLEQYARLMLLVVIYLLCFALCIINHKYIIPDFLGLLLIVVAFFCITFLIHPEYEYVYTREYYGVLPYVLRPDNGLYAYLFVRMVGTPKNLMKGLRLSGYLMMAYSVLLLYFSLRRGYWLGESSTGETIKLSYDLNFGYNLLLPVCTFLCGGLRNKRVPDLLIAAIGVVMILLGGARGPLLGIIIFCVLYIMMTTAESKHKIRNILLVLLVGGGLFIYYRPILNLFATVLDSLNISSRTITKLLEGSISEDNGRSEIWDGAINMIKANPFGYGAMGARNGLYRIHYVGHPHNFFIEILIDYGVILGPIVLAAMLLGSARIFLSKRDDEWKWVYLLFFIQACSLLTSYTYWHSTGVWGALAVAVCVHKSKSRREMPDGRE